MNTHVCIHTYSFQVMAAESAIIVSRLTPREELQALVVSPDVSTYVCMCVPDMYVCMYHMTSFRLL